MSRRVTLTLRDEEAALIERLRDALSPGQALATFAADCLMSAAEAELHGIECRCHEMAQALFNWRPEGQPN